MFNSLLKVASGASASSSQDLESAIFVVSLIVGIVVIGFMLLLVFYTKFQDKEEETSDDSEASNGITQKEPEVKQIACTRCGNTDLAFVNVIYSKKNIGYFLTITIAVMVIALIVLCAIIGFNISEIVEAEFFESQLINGVSIYVMLGIAIDIVSIIISLAAYIKIIPYYNKNEIRYVCKRCGYHNNINTINKQ